MLKVTFEGESVADFDALFRSPAEGRAELLELLRGLKEDIGTMLQIDAARKQQLLDALTAAENKVTENTRKMTEGQAPA